MRLPPDFLQRPIAHRALHDVSDGRPENSRAAITAAIECGYGIEIDLQLSADGQAMVFHDYALERLTGQPGVIGGHSVAELSNLSLIGNDETIPTLAEILDLIGGRVPLLVEVKDQDGCMGPNIGRLEATAATVLETYGGPLAVMSFNPHSVARMAELLPDVPRGIVTSGYRYEDWPLAKETCDHLREIPDYDRVGACFISHEASDLTRPRVSQLKADGADVLCWTIKTKADELEARKVAQNITFEGYSAEHLN